MKIVLFVYALFAIILIVRYLHFRNRYGTRAERRALEAKLLKDMEFLRSQPFTNGKSPSETNKATEIPFDHPSQS